MDEPTSGCQLLAPRSRQAQRLWRVGRAAGPAAGATADLRLAVRPDQHESFATLVAVLEQLQGLAGTEQQAAIARLQGYLRDSVPGADGGATRGRLLADSVAFAIMRRISRESFYTSRVIDLAARLINEVLCRVGCERVHVDDVDRLDRPSLKALARAVLLLKPEQGFTWVWHSALDPAVPVDADVPLAVASRRQLLGQLLAITAPTLERQELDGGARDRRAPAGEPVSLYDVSAALVMQNYDACFAWGESLLGGGADRAEVLRLLALAAVNVGRSDEALRLLGEAEQEVERPGRRAHLCYLQGLIETKRCYDLTRSTAHYQRGLAALAGAAANGDDLALERGWLLNGLALNEAVLWRRSPGDDARFTRAFELEREAFDLVAGGGDPARTYLRFNLLANSAFLLEMKGSYDVAIDVFKRAFDFGLDAQPGKEQRWRSTLGYRIGVLHYRAGRLDEAHRHLATAAEQDAATESWATQERILRALALIDLERGELAAAAATFERGLAVCRDARSAQGTLEHARGLVSALLLDGRGRRAREVGELLAAEEGLELPLADELPPDGWPAALRPSPPSPKLPAYIPEIDLEGIPAVDLNRFLGRAPLAGATGAAPWTGRAR